MATFNHDRAAQLLAEAAIFGLERACERAGVSRQTLWRYRRRLEAGDQELLQLVTKKKDALTREWAADLAPAIRGCIDFIRRAHEKADPANPEVIKAVNGSLKILSDVAQAERVLDARLRGAAGSAGQAPEAPGADGHPARDVH